MAKRMLIVNNWPVFLAGGVVIDSGKRPNGEVPRPIVPTYPTLSADDRARM